MLTLKILFPGTTSRMFLLWFFVWPLPFILQLSPAVAVETAMWLVLALGTVVDIALLSFLSYSGLRVLQRSRPAPDSGLG